MHAYQLHEPIAAGRHATVFRATNNLRGTLHAVKRVPLVRQDMPAYRVSRMLKNEVAHLEELRHNSHNHVVHLDEVLHDEHEAQHVMFLVMELCNGGTLRDCDIRALSYKDKLTLAGQLCKALRTCHVHGICHGDVKPANVVFKQNPAAAAAGVEGAGLRLCDFGSSTRCSAHAGAFVTHATPLYMAPEMVQAAGDTGFAADVWALGVVVYQMLVNDFAAHPFLSSARGDDGSGLLDVSSMLQNVAHRRKQLLEDIDMLWDVRRLGKSETLALEALRDICLGSLQYVPSDRHSTETLVLAAASV